MEATRNPIARHAWKFNKHQIVEDKRRKIERRNKQKRVWDAIQDL